MMNGEIADMQKLGVTVKKNIFKMGILFFKLKNYENISIFFKKINRKA